MNYARNALTILDYFQVKLAVNEVDLYCETRFMQELMVPLIELTVAVAPDHL
jgi:hypothetical protein